MINNYELPLISEGVLLSINHQTYDKLAAKLEAAGAGCSVEEFAAGVLSAIADRTDMGVSVNHLSDTTAVAD